MNFLHKEKKNNIICHFENKGEDVTAVIIGLLPYKALKRFFYQMKKTKWQKFFYLQWYFVFTTFLNHGILFLLWYWLL